MAMVRMLFFFGTVFFVFIKVCAIPTKYDQRQDGGSNVHVKLENLLFVVVIPSNTKEINHLMTSAFEALVLSKEGLITASEVIHQEEPYFSEILQITENRSDKENSVQKAEEGDAGTLNISDQQLTAVEQIEKVERVARNMKNFEFPKSREVPSIPGYFINAKKAHRPKIGNSGQARNIIGNGSNPDVEPEGPKTSLKK